MNYIDTAVNGKSQDPILFSKILTSNFNDGPATFSSNGDTIYFSRNQQVGGALKDISGPGNKLGIFFSVLVNGKWTKPKEMRINNEWYNITTPCLSPDGKRLYFASDKPGGYGGSDLYYSQWKNDYWNDPVNLGPLINSKGNESYPFINQAGELFFSSDGLPGLGGKDIFFSRLKDGNWVSPVPLDPPVNSEYDDFGIVTDPQISEGYFSSNRDKSIDIYKFVTNRSQIFYNDIQRENKYCFMFSDSGSIEIDTTKLEYRWDFGDGKQSSRIYVSHCFPGPGKYNVKLDLVDRYSGKLYFSLLNYKLDLGDYEQAYVNSKDVAVQGDSIVFDGLKSYLPGYKILNYSWDFGDGTKKKGNKVKHAYKERGEYLVNLELVLMSESNGYIRKTGSSKRVTVTNKKGKTSVLSSNVSMQNEYPDIKTCPDVYLAPPYSAETEFKKDAVFKVELVSSKTKIGSNSNIFLKVPKTYSISEIFTRTDSTFHYVIDQQLSLMACYSTFLEMIGAGIKNVHVVLYLLEDPAEKELYNILKIFASQPDSFIDQDNKFTPTAIILLDQIIRILNKYPATRLEIGVYPYYSGNTGKYQFSTQEQAQLIVNHMVKSGINPGRLVAKGFVEAKPLASDNFDISRKLNRQIVFTVVK